MESYRRVQAQSGRCNVTVMVFVEVESAEERSDGFCADLRFGPRVVPRFATPRLNSRTDCI